MEKAAEIQAKFLNAALHIHCLEEGNFYARLSSKSFAPLEDRWKLYRDYAIQLYPCGLNFFTHFPKELDSALEVFGMHKGSSLYDFFCIERYQVIYFEHLIENLEYDFEVLTPEQQAAIDEIKEWILSTGCTHFTYDW